MCFGMLIIILFHAQKIGAFFTLTGINCLCFWLWQQFLAGLKHQTDIKFQMKMKMVLRKNGESQTCKFRMAPVTSLWTTWLSHTYRFVGVSWIVHIYNSRQYVFLLLSFYTDLPNVYFWFPWWYIWSISSTKN